MKAAQVLGHGRVEIIDVPEPVAGDGEVLVQLRRSLLCGSELHGYRGDQPLATNGGHEPSGVVIEAGRSRRWQVGDRVGIHAVWGCGDCDWCARGIYTFCDRKRGCPGAHAERMAAPDHVLVPLPDDVDDEAGALLAGDGLGVPYHTSRRLPTRGGDTVVVVGCGPIGLGNILLQSYYGARVIAIDLAAPRLAMARDCGAAETVAAGESDPLTAVRDLTGGRLATAVVEATGRPEGLALALRLVGKGGTVACCGENREVTIHVGTDLIRRDITLFGSWFFHFREFPDMLALFRNGLALDKLITARYPLDEIGTAFADFAAGTIGKAAIVLPG